MPAVEGIVLIFEALKAYFMFLRQCPTVIQTFFGNPLSEAWMYFVQSQTSRFNNAVIKIQSQLNTALAVQTEVANLKQSLQARKDEAFIRIET
jgi:hypothetical protein